jgi:hypothetical protein
MLGSAGGTMHEPLFSGSMLLPMFGFLVGKVAEMHVSCCTTLNPNDVSFLHTEVLAEMPEVTAWKCSSEVFRYKILHQYPA